MSEIKQGNFYFIKDNFYSIYDKDKKLVQNTGVNHNRPCFFAFKDPKKSNIFWCVPISSKVVKYARIYNEKIENQTKKGINNPKCNTILFGKVKGEEKAFLIQNIFPVIEKYILNCYIYKNNTPVTVAPQTANEIIENAKDVLKLVRSGNPNLVQADIRKIYDSLCDEL
ncbi:MAG: hypothetical protein FWD71_07295 [Oscillospiraceae bacterium]|nr:hypothetical protein [Oscillospiraceae bacterium]